VDLVRSANARRYIVVNNDWERRATDWRTR
jgi:hypothetical protein